MILPHRSLLPLLVALTSPAGGLAQEVVLRLAVPEGTAIALEEASDVTISLTATVGEQSLEIDEEVAVRTFGTARILGTGPDGAPSRMELSIAPGSQTTVTADGETRSAPSPLAGASLILGRDADGTFAVAPDPGFDAETRGGLAKYLDLGAADLPDRAIAVGESWQAPIQFGGAVSAAPAMGTFTLEGLRTEDGREVADVSVRGTIGGTMNGTAMDAAAQGGGVLDVATGLWLRTGIGIEGDLSGSLMQGDTTAAITGTIDGVTRTKNVLTLPDGS